MDYKVFFGKQLKNLVQERYPVQKIGAWSFKYYWDNMRMIDARFSDFLIDLSSMELGPEFEYSYEELDKIADDLMAGKEVTL